MADGVVFDMDGVLVDSAAAHQRSWLMLGEQNDVEMTDAMFERSFGRSGRDIIRMLFGDGVAEDQVHEWVSIKEAIYRDLVRGRLPLMPGVRDAVNDLWNAGYRLAVGTSGPLANVELVLREADLTQCFTQIVTGFDVAEAKPAPDVFQLAGARLGVEPTQCVVIEDAPVGIQAATAAGMPSIGLTGMHDAAALIRAGATRVVDRLSTVTPGYVAAVLRDA